jgi:hypothetical protein
MKNPSLLLCALVLLGGCVRAPSCATPDAQGLVHALRPDEQFRTLLTKTIERTQTAAMVTARDGSGGRAKLAEAIDGAVKRHQAEWERNLADGWQTLTAAEMQQVCAALKGRDQNTFQRFAQRVGPRVQSRNEPLLQRAAEEVLIAAW